MSLIHVWKEGWSGIWGAFSEGIGKLRERALTHFTADRQDAVPVTATGRRLPVASWAYLAVDVYEEEDRIVVRVEAPGMEKGDFSYSIHNNVLTVAGAKRFEKRKDGSQFRLLECAYGTFQRMVHLPVAVLPDAATVRYENGVLYIEVPKLGESTVRHMQTSGA